MNIGNRRASFIDYKKPGIFMITMNKSTDIPKFSSLFIDEFCGDEMRKIRLRLSPIGKIIANGLNNFKYNYKGMEVLGNKIMPDHIHFIIAVKKDLEKQLGTYLSIFKRLTLAECIKSNLIPASSKILFERGFNDQFLSWKRNLNCLFRYMEQNPYRLWIRQEHPDFFMRLSLQDFHGSECAVYGNLSLKDNPFIYPVIIHRRDTEQELNAKIERWRYAIYNGGVLAGAFISPKEKEIMKEAMDNDGKIILLSNHGFEDREKPSGRLFHHCSRGNLLIISPKLPAIAENRNAISREFCLMLNSLAEKIGTV